MAQASAQAHPTRGFRSALSRGPVVVAKEFRHRFYSWYYERRLGVETGGWILEKDLDYESPDGKPYAPIGYEHVFWALNQIPIPAQDVELVDFGAGKGRAIIAAAMKPFRSVTGVELSATLAGVARRNLDTMQGRRAKQAQVANVNALDFAITPTANVFYFFNPFDGTTLHQVVENIRASFAAHPRKGFVIFFNQKHMDAAVAGQTWIRKTYQGEFYPEYGCGLYEIG
jgi:16S rRNA G966 N2-methylase RsmD